MRPPGPLEIGLILVIILIVFGVGKLPQVGAAFGKGIRAFKRGQSDEEEEEEKPKRRVRRRKTRKKATKSTAEKVAEVEAEAKAKAEEKA